MDNETLDLNETPRWNAVFRTVQRGKSEHEIAREVLRCLCKTLRRVMKYRPLGEWLSADCIQAVDVQRLLRAYKCRDYARLFVQVSEAERGHSVEVLMEAYLAAIADKFLDQLAVKYAGTDNWPHFGAFRTWRDQVMETIADPLHRIAADLAGHPDQPPRTPARHAASLEERTEEMLSESMLR